MIYGRNYSQYSVTDTSQGERVGSRGLFEPLKRDTAPLSNKLTSWVVDPRMPLMTGPSKARMGEELVPFKPLRETVTEELVLKVPPA